MSVSVHALLAEATRKLHTASRTPRLDAEVLLAWVLGWNRARLVAERDYVPDDSQVVAFESLVARRYKLEPVAYLVGYREFYGLDILVDHRVLIPRPETELLVDIGFASITTYLVSRSHMYQQQPLHVADIGTGSGAIALALACYAPQIHVHATDISAEALAVAAHNSVKHGVSERVTLYQGDLLSPLPCPVDILISNPPYTVLDEIDAGVRLYEPHLALDGGTYGIEVYRRLLAQAPHHVRAGGSILLEIDARQASVVTDLARHVFAQASITVHQDLAGFDRVVAIALP